MQFTHFNKRDQNIYVKFIEQSLRGMKGFEWKWELIALNLSVVNVQQSI